MCLLHLQEIKEGDQLVIERSLFTHKMKLSGRLVS